jgi:hypothetical protein
MTDRATVEFVGGEIVLWDDGGVLMLKQAEPHGDPVELNEHQALELANSSSKWARAQRL